MYPYDRDEAFMLAIAMLKDAIATPSASHRAYNVKEVRKLLKQWEQV